MRFERWSANAPHTPTSLTDKKAHSGAAGRPNAPIHLSLRQLALSFPLEPQPVNQPRTFPQMLLLNEVVGIVPERPLPAGAIVSRLSRPEMLTCARMPRRY